jgi:beta-glucosidase
MSGLSYTTFEYSEPVLSQPELPAGGSVIVKVDVKNTGARAGEEVVQLYIADKTSDDPRPQKDLRGFERISLNPGETKTVGFEINPSTLAYWNVEKHAYVPTVGQYEIMVGSSSADKDLKKLTLEVKE